MRAFTPWAVILCAAIGAVNGSPLLGQAPVTNPPPTSPARAQHPPPLPPPAPQFTPPAWRTNRAFVEGLIKARSNRMWLQTNVVAAAPGVSVVTTPPVSVALPAVPKPATPTAQSRRGSAPIRVPHLQATQPASYLAWDADVKEITAAVGATNIQFVFWVTNVSSEEVMISYVHSTCGCTAARLPSLPWRLAPEESGPIRINMDIRNYSGPVIKTAVANTSTGDKTLVVCARVPAPTNAPADPPLKGGMITPERARRQQVAMADRQAVFKPDCAQCHLNPAKDKTGAELYIAVCGVCHEAEQRAPTVPDLKRLPHPADAAYWRKWVVGGRPGSMMPAFGRAEGGPLSEGQINTLVEYLAATFKGGFQTSPSAPPAPAHIRIAPIGAQ